MVAAKGDVVSKCHDVNAAEYTRDALAKVSIRNFFNFKFRNILALFLLQKLRLNVTNDIAKKREKKSELIAK